MPRKKKLLTHQCHEDDCEMQIPEDQDFCKEHTIEDNAYGEEE